MAAASASHIRDTVDAEPCRYMTNVGWGSWLNGGRDTIVMFPLACWLVDISGMELAPL